MLKATFSVCHIFVFKATRLSASIIFLYINDVVGSKIHLCIYFYIIMLYYSIIYTFIYYFIHLFSND